MPITCYNLNTVTYGTASALFLAIHTLQQVANDESENYPTAKAVLLNDFYMDGVLTGTNNIEQAITLQKQLDDLLLKGCFKLRKWRTNNATILNYLTIDSKADNMLVIEKCDANDIIH
ncbi:hypothetical protein QE152_g6151 [Popillia japonica]|uniref:Uncharacterized protein n=1 Tax=Popillia japonica TaxID=7064 RepID=A0AAW1MIU3_POPJA